MSKYMPAFVQSGQNRILLLSWCSYALAYTLRVNLAVIIPVLILQRGYTYMQMGMITSVYFATYMIGQLINGYLGDHFSSKWLICTGLFISALCNIAMPLASKYEWLIVFWGINGLAQSMLWAPIMKTLTNWFARYQLEKVSFIMAKSMIIGYAASWGLTSILVAYFSWTWAFYLPAGLVILFCLVLLIGFVEKPKEESIKSYSGLKKTDRKIKNTSMDMEQNRKPIGEYFRMIHLPSLLIIAIMQGIIREGIGTWFPTILQQVGSAEINSYWIILVLVPIVNLVGIIFVRMITHKLDGDSSRTMLFIFTIIAVIALLAVIFSARTVITISLIVLLLALSYGMTPILTSIIPFQYAQYGRVSFTVGILDFSIYLGAAIASILSGHIADRYNWNGVIYFWISAAICGLFISFYRYRKSKMRKTNEQNIHIKREWPVV